MHALPCVTCNTSVVTSPDILRRRTAQQVNLSYHIWVMIMMNFNSNFELYCVFVRALRWQKKSRRWRYTCGRQCREQAHDVDAWRSRRGHGHRSGVLNCSVFSLRLYGCRSSQPRASAWCLRLDAADFGGNAKARILWWYFEVLFVLCLRVAGQVGMLKTHASELPYLHNMFVLQLKQCRNSIVKVFPIYLWFSSAKPAVPAAWCLPSVISSTVIPAISRFRDATARVPGLRCSQRWITNIQSGFVGHSEDDH